MELSATITNNTGESVSLNMREFFAEHDGPQLVSVEDGGSHTASASCYPPQAEKKFRAFCASNGYKYSRKDGLYLVVNAGE